jgi:hypothetical protein
MPIESISTLALSDDQEEVSKITPEPIEEKKEKLIQVALSPGSIIQGQRPIDMICLLKYKLGLSSEKYQRETGEKITPNEWGAQLKGNLRGMVFERLSSLIPVNPTNNIIFTTQTETYPIATSSIHSLKRATRFYAKKSELINSITEDRAKQSEMQAATVIPDNLLVGPNDEIVGFVEDRCFTPDEIDALADKLEKDPSDFLHTLDREIEFLKLVIEVREEKLGIGTKPQIIRGREQLPQQPEINKGNATIVLRFPTDAPVESLRKIGMILARNGYQIEIQTLPFTSKEVDDIGKTLLRKHAAMIHYGVGNPSFGKDEIEMVESYAEITSNDIEDNLIKVTGKGAKPEDLKLLTDMSLIEKLYK